MKFEDKVKAAALNYGDACYAKGRATALRNPGADTCSEMAERNFDILNELLSGARPGPKEVWDVWSGNTVPYTPHRFYKWEDATQFIADQLEAGIEIHGVKKSLETEEDEHE